MDNLEDETEGLKSAALFKPTIPQSPPQEHIICSNDKMKPKQIIYQIKHFNLIYI
jgi:hypothetical protein